jgi:hypothetical protein
VEKEDGFAGASGGGTGGIETAVPLDAARRNLRIGKTAAARSPRNRSWPARWSGTGGGQSQNRTRCQGGLQKPPPIVSGIHDLALAKTFYSTHVDLPAMTVFGQGKGVTTW